MNREGKFYLGRLVEIDSGKVSPTPYLLEPDDLTTHAVVVGMTGSGKTGLCIDLLEEAALAGIPALMIDPKGDITNTLLHFPDLLPADFQPWVDPDQARREGQSVEAAAQAAAETWRSGLQSWEITPADLQALKNAAHFTIYTPGSTAGVPVSILASLKAPALDWQANRELLREKIASTVTALLGLVGMEDIDPVRSREHILLANIFEHAWSQGKDLELGELILQAQTPPFSKLGIFDVNTFFPEKDRFGLAMLLNNILAAPTFQAWIEGQPLDIPSLLFGPDGRPRHSVFYIAHLSEAERMFFVTLLYSAVESWMRTQPGSAVLRALLYFDEIFGYLPPVQNPPCKPVMLRMLKQARAFGVGQVLVTQNPVDIDYKALSNAGAWFIGKLQTENDKQRLLDGLQSAASGSLDTGEYQRLITGLGKRVFLVHNVHAKATGHPTLFQTRWAMNYLPGPLTRAQIPALNALAGVGAAHSTAAPPAGPVMAGGAPAPEYGEPAQASFAAPPAAAVAGTPTFLSTRPALPAGIAEYFLPNNLSFTQAFNAAGQPFPPEAMSQGLVYRPVLLAQAELRIIQRKYNLEYSAVRTALAQPDRRGTVRWEEAVVPAVDPAQLESRPAPQAQFAPLEGVFANGKLLAPLERDFIDWVYRTTKVALRANETLKVYAGPDVSQAEFRKMCSEAAREGRDKELEKIGTTFDRKLDALRTKLEREERELSQDQTELSQRKMEEMGTHAENLFGMFTGRRGSRRLTSSLSKRRMTEQAKADVEESHDAIKAMKAEIAALEKEKAQAEEEIRERWGEMANQDSEMNVTPLKKDVLTDLFGVAWFPYYRVQSGGEVSELPGYTA